MNQTSENATSHKVLYLLNIAALAVVLYLNYLANALPLNGRTPGELSDLYPNLFVPAGLTFSIWGIIYLWILIWVGMQAVALLTGKQAPGAAKAGWWFLATCLLNIGWLFAWHWEQLLLSVGVMITLLYCLVRLNQAISNGISADSPWEKWTAHLVFGLYQGWITVALIANVTALLVGSGWKGGTALAESDWAIIMVEAGAALAVVMVWKFNHLFHGVAVAWALYGIYLKRTAEVSSDSTFVAWAALAGMALVAGFVVLNARKWWSY